MDYRQYRVGMPIRYKKRVSAIKGQKDSEGKYVQTTIYAEAGEEAYIASIYTSNKDGDGFVVSRRTRDDEEFHISEGDYELIEVLDSKKAELYASFKKQGFTAQEIIEFGKAGML